MELDAFLIKAARSKRYTGKREMQYDNVLHCEERSNRMYNYEHFTSAADCFVVVPPPAMTFDWMPQKLLTAIPNKRQ